MSVNSKLACIALSLTFFIQSCSIYKTSPVTLNEAFTQERKTKIELNSGEKIILEKIEFTNNVYYGYAIIRNQTIRIPLNESEIKNIHVLDKSSTRVVNTIITTTSLGLLILFVYALVASGGAY